MIAYQKNRFRVTKSRAAEIASQEDARRHSEAARAQADYLAQLASRQNPAWVEVEGLVSTRQPKSYDQAISLLKDLRDVACQSGEMSRFATRLAVLLERHAKKAAFCERVSRAWIMPEPARAC